jgi:hypothetical protein
MSFGFRYKPSKLTVTVSSKMAIVAGVLAVKLGSLSTARSHLATRRSIAFVLPYPLVAALSHVTPIPSPDRAFRAKPYRQPESHSTALIP